MEDESVEVGLQRLPAGSIDKLHKLTRGPAGKSQAESSGNNKLQILVTSPRCSS
jgi:hypothetical protein